LQENAPRIYTDLKIKAMSTEESSETSRRRRHHHHHHAVHLRPAAPWKIQAHVICDGFSEVLIYLMIVFSPWAFGTTEDWSINIMNYLGYGLGGLLAVKLALRWTSSGGFSRWNDDVENSESSEDYVTRLHFLTRALAVLTMLILGYCAISAYNARSVYDWNAHAFNELRHLEWLPASFDQPSTWKAFYMYLALAIDFWAIHDWLQGKTGPDEVATRIKAGEPVHHARRLPDRFRRLLWVLCINGGLLAVEGMIQRFSGTGELLFMRRPSVTHFEAQSQFGPYAYRSNACQYLCLLWPVCLGFWWSLHRLSKSSDYDRRRLARYRHVAIVCVGLMVLAPLLSSSRVGGVTDLVLMIVTTSIIWTAMKDRKAKMMLVSGGAVVLIVGLMLGWGYLAPRLSEDDLTSSMMGRKAIYEAGEKMFDDYPMYGTGPGTLMTLYQFYRPDAGEWVAQMHNDWLETLVTFGWAGTTLVCLSFLIVITRWLVPGGVGGGRRLPYLIWCAMAGCFFQAVWDFPFQVYSVIFAFILLCSVVSVMTRRRIIPDRNE